MSKGSTTSRINLPKISSASTISYAQKYQHMTKLANYSEMNEGQIWKEYEKLRACLKQINGQVLYHMERKAYSNLPKEKQSTKLPNKDSEVSLLLLDDQKKTNQLRYSNFYNQLSKLEQRHNYLSGKPNYLSELTLKTEEIEAKIKRIKTENKDYKRKAKVIGKNIVNCTSALDKLVLEEDKLNRAIIRHRRIKQHLDGLSSKEQRYRERISETQAAIDARLRQFTSQQNFIEEEIHYQRYQELKKQKENLSRFEPIYKRNYLMKLKELEIIVNSINKHDRIIQETQGNILNMRQQIELISQVVGARSQTQRKRTNSSLLQMSANTIRIRSKENARKVMDISTDFPPAYLPTTKLGASNDKNRDKRTLSGFEK